MDPEITTLQNDSVNDNDNHVDLTEDDNLSSKDPVEDEHIASTATTLVKPDTVIDEGIDEGEYSKKDDTYSSDSLTENTESLTLIDADLPTVTQPPHTLLDPDDPPTLDTTPSPSLNEPNDPSELATPNNRRDNSASPNTNTTLLSNEKRKSSSSSSKGKRKNTGDFKPTVVKPFSFCLDKRIEERQKYNERVQKMQKAQEERERLERERLQKEEEDKWKEERKKTILKAQPIRYYKPITITPSKKALTIPEGPTLRLESRNRTKPQDTDELNSNNIKHVL